jgi:phage-related holin
MRLFTTWLVNLLTLSAKTEFSVRLAVVLTSVLPFIERNLFSDWHFLGSLCVLIMVDTVFGVQRNWVTHSISSRAFSRLFTKASIYLGLLVLTHQLTTYQVHGVVNGVFGWFDTFMYSCMMAREAVSILEHVACIEPRLVPKGLLKRLALISDEGITAGLAAMPVAQHSDAPLNLTTAPALDVATPDVAPAEVAPADASLLTPN